VAVIVAGEAHVAEDEGEDMVDNVEWVVEVEVVGILLGAKQLQALFIFKLDVWQFAMKVGNVAATVRICVGMLRRMLTQKLVKLKEPEDNCLLDF
jgi:hypothetical protein